jgi:hypothetical protein
MVKRSKQSLNNILRDRQRNEITKKIRKMCMKNTKSGTRNSLNNDWQIERDCFGGKGVCVKKKLNPESLL